MPFAVANINLPLLYRYIFEIILYLDKYIKLTKTPGRLLCQYFLGNSVENVIWPIFSPQIYGVVVKDPVVYFRTPSSFFPPIIEYKTQKDLFQLKSKKVTTLCLFNACPFEYTVVRPLLFLPALFLIKYFSCLCNLLYLNENKFFLKRSVFVIGLYFLIKIFLNKI